MSTTSLTGPATELDEAVVTLSPPVDFFSGQAAGLRVTDQFHRGKQILGRFERSGLLGFKVAPRGRRLRVRVTLAVDASSMPGWYLEGGPGRLQAAGLPPRLLQVRAQGRLRQCLLLKGGTGIKSAQAVFDLLPEEVPEDGLVCLEVLDIAEGRGVSAAAREAVAGSVMAAGTAGLRVDNVTFEESKEQTAREETLDAARCELLSLISAGGLANLNRRGLRTARAGLFVVNPLPPGLFGSGGRLVIRLGSKADTAVPAGSRTLARRVYRRAGGEARRLRHVAREVFCAAAPAVTGLVSVQDGALDGPSRASTGNTLELDLSAPVNSPMLVLLSPREGTVPTLLSVTWTP